MRMLLTIGAAAAAAATCAAASEEEAAAAPPRGGASSILLLDIGDGSLLSRIHRLRGRANSCREQAGRSRYPVSYAAERSPSLAFRKWVRKLWAGRLSACGRLARALPGRAAALRWYQSSTTQCVVNHEGGWRSVSESGTYHGRFQMDSSFERMSAVGRRAQARWGRASNWPPLHQVVHAFLVWSRDGWSHWPTYRRYCA